MAVRNLVSYSRLQEGLQEGYHWDNYGRIIWLNKPCLIKVSELKEVLGIGVYFIQHYAGWSVNPDAETYLFGYTLGYADAQRVDELKALVADNDDIVIYENLKDSVVYNAFNISNQECTVSNVIDATIDVRVIANGRGFEYKAVLCPYAAESIFPSKINIGSRMIIPTMQILGIQINNLVMKNEDVGTVIIGRDLLQFFKLDAHNWYEWKLSFPKSSLASGYFLSNAMVDLNQLSKCTVDMLTNVELFKYLTTKYNTEGTDLNSNCIDTYINYNIEFQDWLIGHYDLAYIKTLSIISEWR